MKSPHITSAEFASFVEQHSRIINKICWVYATPKVPYEDLHQEILTNLWLGLEQFRGTGKISTWVYRVAVNSALMAIRNYKSKVEVSSIEISVEDISSEADDNKTEQLSALHELINQLLPIEKAIILLWLDGYTYEEIADIIGIERNNVATKLHRIKNKLISKSK
ncbi:MAG: sigma-70 family RNA polymerase sigma factor [Odoribacter sp.]|nr:sigma-70 family RNA polymerase sigma factor [Odoribacter sp.]